MGGISMHGRNYSTCIVERLWKLQASTITPQFLKSVEYIDFFLCPVLIGLSKLTRPPTSKFPSRMTQGQVNSVGP